MGISGHILGPKKLRKLSELTALPLNRAMKLSNRYAEGVVWDGENCTHYAINPTTGEYEVQIVTTHWFSCPRVAARLPLQEALPNPE